MLRPYRTVRRLDLLAAWKCRGTACPGRSSRSSIRLLNLRDSGCDVPILTASASYASHTISQRTCRRQLRRGATEPSGTTGLVYNKPDGGRDAAESFRPVHPVLTLAWLLDKNQVPPA